MRRFVLLAASVAAVVVLGLVAAWTQVATAHTVDQVHRADRNRLQTTLAGLTDQYLQFTFLATQDGANGTAWTLRPDAAADRAALQRLVDASPLTSYGAALTTLTGAPLTTYSTGPGLPPPTDPGYAPLRADLLAGKPGLSAVLHAADGPLVAFAVPVRHDGAPVGLLVTYADVRSWPLQGYTAHLDLGRTARSYILDGTGTVAASAVPATLGQRLAGLPAVARSGGHGITTYADHGRSMVVSYGPSGNGWTALTIQEEQAFSGSLQASRQRAALALVVLLTLVVLLLVLFHHKRQQALRRLADERLYDPLTGLAQRRLFDIRMQAVFARQRRSGAPLALLYCDLDRFKAVNDSHGHAVGDELLVVLAKRLTDAVRDDDFVVRLGGDEFAVVLEATDATETSDLARRLRDAVQAPVTVDGRILSPRVSIGGAVLYDASRAEELLPQADQAMYQAKTSGCGYTVVVIDELARTPRP